MRYPACLLCSASALVWLVAAGSVCAQVPLHQRIDQEIESGTPKFAGLAAPLAADTEFLRRVALDLTGIVPTAAEVRAFLKESNPDKRRQVIDRLLASPGYARHMQNVFDVLLMDRRPGKHVKTPEWQEYLRSSLAANKPYDQLVREILSADGADPKTRPAARFYLDRDGETHQLTRDISRLFLGMNLQCAQCHDHPLVETYRQDHYYGVYAFLSRSFVFTDKAKNMAVFAEKAEGDVAYESVFLPKVKKNTGPRLPDGAALAEPKLDKGKEYDVAPKPNVRPVPKFSRRAQLAGQVVENPRFKRAAANRLWAMMLGRGLVHPVEFDHEHNPPSHPKLLTLLVEDFAARKFDTKAVLREIALSKTYQRSTTLPQGIKEVPDASFAVGQLRPLSPEQLAWSMMQATGLIEAERQALGPKAAETAIFNRLVKNVDAFVKVFGSSPGEPAEQSFEATLDQTLFLNNGDVIRSWLVARPGNLTDRLGKINDNATVAEELYLSILARMPTAEETKEVGDFLASRSADRPAALQDLAWALLTSVEFRFNH
jgi:hypothetical protein